MHHIFRQGSESRLTIAVYRIARTDKESNSLGEDSHAE
jgi:hypothetical protein